MRGKHLTPSEKVYTSLYNIIPASTDDESAQDRLALRILQMMKDDAFPPNEIFEAQIRANYKPDTPDLDFGFFFGLFERTNYKLDPFFLNTFLEVLAVRMGLREPAYKLLSQLVTKAQTGGEK